MLEGEPSEANESPSVWSGETGDLKESGQDTGREHVSSKEREQESDDQRDGKGFSFVSCEGGDQEGDATH